MFGKFLILMIFVIGCSFDTKQQELIGIVNGKEIRGSDIARKFKLSEEELRDLSPYQKIKLFEEYAPELVLEYEASRTGLSKENLIGFFDRIKKISVTDTDIQNYIRENPDKRHLEKSALIDLIKEHRLKMAKLKYETELKQRSTVRALIQISDTGL